MSPFKSNYRVCLVNTFLIENSESFFFFFHCRCQKCPRGIIAYQLLTLCSTGSVAQSRQSLQGFKFNVTSRGFFPQLICYMALDMANSDASSVTVKVVNTDESSSNARSSAIHKGKFNVPLSGDEPNDLSNIMKQLKIFTGLAKIAKNKGLREKLEVMIVISYSFIILRCKKLFLFCLT